MFGSWFDQLAPWLQEEVIRATWVINNPEAATEYANAESMWEMVLEVLGIGDLLRCLDGGWGSCAWFAAGFIPIPVGRLASAAKGTLRFFSAAARHADDVPWAASCTLSGLNSFSAHTEVLMADGTYKPVEDIESGDLVLATDPETGLTDAKLVVDIIVGTGQKAMVDITIVDPTGLATTEGNSVASSTAHGPTGLATVTATGGHPFWEPQALAWVKAADLQPGDHLVTADTSHVFVSSATEFQAALTVYNLTVADFHTYYVVAGTTPLLVHNTTVGGCGTSPATTRVGRWMSQAEYEQMLRTGYVQQGTGGRTYVVRTGNPDDYRSAAPGSVFVQFDVPTSALKPAGRPEWAVIPGPGVTTRIYGPPPASMPRAGCTQLICGN
jgi:hypothetical protein